jgi:8-oxo-dGTP pyrophosphatase MutT (NUDIX family)
MASGPRSPPRAWKVLRSAYDFSDRWIRLRRDTVLLPEGPTEVARPLLEFADWVDVIALTPTFDIVLVEQYRHAVGEVRTEFPAGVVDGTEKPLSAIQRELREETGYISEDWRGLGSAPVHPAWQTNRIHSFLALGAYKAAEQDLDEGEVIRFHEMPFADFITAVESGDIALPALQLAGLYLLQAYLRRSDDPALAALRF